MLSSCFLFDCFVFLFVIVLCVKWFDCFVIVLCVKWLFSVCDCFVCISVCDCFLIVIV